MSGSKKKVIKWAVLVIFLVAYVIRLYCVWLPYQKYTTVFYDVGETFTECGLEFTVNGWQQLSLEEFEALYGETEPADHTYYKEMDEVFYVVSYTVSNPTREDLYYERMAIELQGETWSVQGAQSLNQVLEEEAMTITVKSGETRNFLYAYQTLSVSFGRNWGRAMKEPRHLVFSMESEKRVVPLTEETRRSVQTVMSVKKESGICHLRGQFQY